MKANTRVDSRVPFEVAAYDKDSDVYTIMHTTPSESMALRIGRSLKKLIESGTLRRSDSKTREPYDWVVIYHGDNVRAVI